MARTTYNGNAIDKSINWIFDDVADEVITDNHYRPLPWEIEMEATELKEEFTAESWHDDCADYVIGEDTKLLAEMLNSALDCVDWIGYAGGKYQTRAAIAYAAVAQRIGDSVIRTAIERGVTKDMLEVVLK